MIHRTANKYASGYVDNKQAFQGSNLWGHWVRGHRDDGIYAVYSYGPHYPALVFDATADQWFYNDDRYSPTTSKHMSQIGRRGEPRNTEQLKEIIFAGGVVNLVSKRIDRANWDAGRHDRWQKAWDEFATEAFRSEAAV
jgi:hypothetical protein